MKRVGDHWTESSGYAICTFEGIKRFDFNEQADFEEEKRKLESMQHITLRKV
jgi:hypothetical protein